MLLALAVLLLHPQMASTVSISAKIAANDAAPTSAVSTASATNGRAEAAPADSTTDAAMSAAEPPTAAQPEASSGAELPDAPVPVLVAVATNAPAAFIKSGTPYTVSVAQLQAEDRRKNMIWTGLAVASSSAAMFDAITTRHAITTYGAVELNPMLKPFAGNSSLFAAIQVAPALLDYAGRRMMYSKHQWMRRVWFVPQGASFVSSIFCGAHNLSYR